MPFKPARVLVVDDHSDSRVMIGMVVEGLGHVVFTAGSAQEAKTACECEAPFDLLIADMALPDGSGIDVMRTMLNHCMVPAIAVSGRAAESDIRAGIEAGFAAYIIKPFNVDELERKINLVLAAAAR